jgi:cobalt-precorrin 5A hydrolase
MTKNSAMDFAVSPQIPESSIAIVALTRNGVELALQIQSKMPGSECYVPERHQFALAMGARGFERIRSVIPKLWVEYRRLIFIMATGIVVRQIGPLMRLKTVDPAVVVLDERGNFSISLVSGHLGGANDLARKVASITGGQAVITTASDVRGKPSLDLIAQEKGLEIENITQLKNVSRAILENEPLRVYDPHAILRSHLSRIAGIIWIEDPIAEVADPQIPCVWTSERMAPPGWSCLILRPRNLVVGIGCNRNTPTEEILELIRTVFMGERLAVQAIRNLASLDLKADERSIMETAAYLGRPVYFYPRSQVENVSVPNPSTQVLNLVGVRSVCEATALLSAQQGVLIVPKRKTRNVTLAVVRADYQSLASGRAMSIT